MRNRGCSHEIAVTKAVRTGLWDSALRDHAAQCGVCGESVISATAIRSLTADLEDERHLPDAGWLWRKALLEQKQAETDRALRLFGLAQSFSMPMMVLAVVVLIWWGSGEVWN